MKNGHLRENNADTLNVAKRKKKKRKGRNRLPEKRYKNRKKETASHLFQRLIFRLQSQGVRSCLSGSVSFVMDARTPLKRFSSCV